MATIKNIVRENKNQEVDQLLAAKIAELNEEGYAVEFGKIGTHTTYALAYNKETDSEIVGYTFIRDMKYYKENVGQLKAIQQVIARKAAAENIES